MKEQRDTTRIRRPAILMGLFLVAVNAYWVGIASEVWYAVYTLVSPFSNAIFSLAVLLGANALLKRSAPRFSFTSAELLLIYVMVTMVSTISGHAMMAILMGTLAHPFWFSTPENQYGELFHRFIPEWMTVRDPQVLAGYFQGDSTFYTLTHLRAWLMPVLVWSGFITLLYGSLLCFGLLLRRHWMEREKLSFPLTELPLQMATNPEFWRSRLLWLGVGCAAFVRVLAGIHDLFPAIPAFPPNYRLDTHFPDRPWNAMGYLSLSFNLAVIGLAFFMPLDLSFSTWFFFWLTRAERVIADMAGWQNLRLNERASGAWVGIAVLALWSARRHLGEIFLLAVRQKVPDDSDEPLPARTLVGLTVVSVVGVFAFCLVAGMSFWVVVVFYALFLAFALSIGYVRAALGPPYHEVIGIGPREMMVDMFGTRRLGGGNLTLLTFLYAFNRCNRSHPMPNQVESLRIGDKGGIPGRTLVWGMGLAIGFGALMTFWSYLDFSYRYGVLARCRGWVGHFGWESFNPLTQWIQSPQESDGEGIFAMLGGMLFVFFLQLMRTRLLWWPLHASGYVLSGAAWGGLIYFWFPVMVSWLLKLLILRFGGLPSYRRMTPFFLGFVLGDFVPRSILSFVSLALNVYMPSSGSGHTL